MKYKFMEAQIEGAKKLAEENKNIKMYQDILDEHMEVLKKAQAFEEVATMYINRKECNISDEDILRVLQEQIDKYRDFTKGEKQHE